MEPKLRAASFIHISPSSSDIAIEESNCIPQNLGGTRSPRTFSRYNIVNKSNKRRQEYSDTGVLIENELIQLCRAKDWRNVLRRCRSNPDEAVPKQIPDNQEGNRFYSHSSKRCVNDNKELLGSDVSDVVYYETPLGLACASNELDSDILHEVVISLIMACPYQVRASQLIRGHTPLRDAILNDRCDCVVLRALLDGEIICEENQSRIASSLTNKDKNGHCPVDHLMMGVQLGSSSRPLKIFKTYFEHTAHKMSSVDSNFTPLVKLFTIVSSLCTPSSPIFHYWRPNTPNGEEEKTTQRRRVIEATTCLLASDQSYLFRNSQMTGCSPLHAALRNFGNCLPLINLLTSRPGAKKLLGHRNKFGDLPIHVACSVGVPFEVLKVVVECTIAAVPPSDMGSPFSTHPLLWSLNSAGYTPIDLEWVRHIEGGHGFYNTRSFYPLEPSGVRMHCYKEDEYYQELLREAVDKVLVQNSSQQTISKESDIGKQVDAREIFGSLLDRLSLLVSASSCSIPSTSSPTLLHNVCKLSALCGPNLPRPLMELFLCIYRGQVLLKDQYGMLPLHYAINCRVVDGACIGTKCDTAIWKQNVLQLLSMEPASSQIFDHNRRLPLHTLLEFTGTTSNDSTALRSIVQVLVEYYPESVDHPDPVTGLDPYLLAAQNPSLDLEVVYTLLRHSPSRCARRDATA